MKKRPNIYALLAAGILCLLTAACSLSQRTDTMAQKAQKARYYYLAGVQAQGNGELQGAYEYFRKAHQLDPDYKEAAYQYASLRLASTIDTLKSLAEIRHCAQLMRPFVDAYPGDYDEAIMYSRVASVAGLDQQAAQVLERTDSLLPGKSETLLRLYEVYSKTHQIDKALATLNRLEKSEGINPQISFQKAFLRFAQKDTVGGLSEIDALVAHNPRDPNSLLIKGNIYESIERPDSAIAYYKKAELLDRDFGPAKLALADIYNAQGDSVAYDAKIYEALLSENLEVEDKVDLLGKYLTILLSNNYDRKRGDHLFEVLRKQYPHSAEVLALSAEYNAAKGDLKSAQEEIQYAVDQAPAVENYHYKLIRFLLADKKPKEAMEAYDRAKEQLTPTPPMIFAYAAAAQMNGDRQKSNDAFGVLIHQIIPTLPLTGRVKVSQIPRDLNIKGLEAISNYFASIGDNLQVLDSVGATIDAYENALTFDPQNAVALNNYAFFLAEKGNDLEKALELSRRSLDTEEYKNNASHLDTYAWILFRTGNIKEARSVQADAVKAAQKDEAESYELYDHYGDILAADEATDEAILYYEKALKLAPDNKSISEKIKKLKKHEK